MNWVYQINAIEDGEQIRESDGLMEQTRGRSQLPAFRQQMLEIDPFGFVVLCGPLKNPLTLLFPSLKHV